MHLLENSKLVFAGFVLAAFIYPNLADALKYTVIPVLMVMMALSIKDLKWRSVSHPDIKIALRLIATNYILLSGSILLLSYLFITDPVYLSGFILLAAVPPAVAIIPFVYLYKGDVRDSLVGEVAGYLFALLFSPLLVYLLLGESVDIMLLLKILVLLIIVPFFLGPLFRRLKFSLIERPGTIINICYGISIYVFIALNRSTILNEYKSLIPILLVTLFTTFGLAWLIFNTLKLRHVKKSEDIMYVLFGTFKNQNTAATIGLLLIGPAAAMPVAVRALLTPLFIYYLEHLFARHEKLVQTARHG
jgi:bile acid:Na+ symporter, BASS family